MARPARSTSFFFNKRSFFEAVTQRGRPGRHQPMWVLCFSLLRQKMVRSQVFFGW
jgi:hypothetical protein